MSELVQLHTDAGGPIPGDCWRTAIACLLDLDDPTVVPHFAAEYPDGPEWWDATVRYVEQAWPGWTLQCTAITFPVYVPDATCAPDVVIATGPSPRGDFLHAVLVSSDTGALVWDPHPSGAGLAGPPTELAALVTAKNHPTPPVNPDCRGGKHRACAGDAWDEQSDQPTRCACTCHAAAVAGGPLT